MSTATAANGKAPAKARSKPLEEYEIQHSVATKYLISYNVLSACLWYLAGFHVLSILITTRDPANIVSSSAIFIKEIQTLAVLEVLHSAFGLVRASLFATTMQVASRLLLVWGIVEMFPEIVGGKTPPKDVRIKKDGEVAYAYATMLFAWSFAEVIRYWYFVLYLAKGTSGVPNWLAWLRYNAFIVLYPVGIISELILIFAALPHAQKWNANYGYFLMAAMASYIPGSYFLYTHMIAQRKRASGKIKVV